MSARKGEGLPPGIRRRHARSCPAVASDDMAVCGCRPSYQAQAGPRGARQTRTWPTLAAAKSWKRDVERAHERGELTGVRAPKIRDAWRDWLAKAQSGAIMGRSDRPYRPSTLRRYQHAMEAPATAPLLECRLDQVTRQQLTAYVQSMQARGMAAQSVKNAVVPLRALYRHVIELGVVATNPTTGLRVPAGSGRRMRFLTPQEIQPLLDPLDERDRALWATAIYAGLRRGELMALRWSDVDLAAGVITVSLSYDQPSRTMGAVKSIAGQDRRVPIIAALREHLLAHRLRAGARAPGLVFDRRSLAGAVTGHCGPADGPFADRAVARRAQQAWSVAGVQAVTFHECRHTFASLMIHATAAAGTFNPKAIQTMLGHALIQHTYDRYGHLFPGTEMAAGRMLDAFLESENEALPVVTEPCEDMPEHPAGVPRIASGDGGES